MSGRITVDQIVGSWRLERAVQVFADGSRLDEFGPEADGYLSYTAQGIVMAVLGSSTRPRLDTPDPQAATPADYAVAARQFIAYAGRFTIDGGGGEVTHHIDVSLFPNWEGEQQPRKLRVDGERLIILASDRVALDGRTFHVELHWQRP